MNWLQHLSEAIRYIEDNLEEEISYDEIARVACCSSTYFQRMFTYISGITLSEYIRRRKMTCAAFDIQSSDKKLLDIGLKYRYSSPSAFNRAFRHVHDIAPSSARKTGIVLKLFPPLKLMIQITGEKALKYKIFFLSSALVPLENISGGFRLVVLINPFTYIVNGIRLILINECIRFHEVMMIISMLIVMCCASLILALWKLNSEMRV
mgnify:CR=1 FL=1